jgi:hypothetical protein
MGAALPLETSDTYLRFPVLVGRELPKKVRKLRKLQAQCATLEALDSERKALSKDVDGDLAAAGLARNDLVTCLGYEVIRRGKAGTKTISVDVLREVLVAKGMDGAVIDSVIALATKEGDPSSWAELRVPKGAKVRR